MYTEEEKKQIATNIDSEIDDLELEIEDLEELTKPIAPDNSYGRLSRMDAINNKATMENTLRMKKKRLDELQTAKRNLDKKGFGRCEKCGKQIELQRILFIPESKVCMDCK